MIIGNKQFETKNHTYIMGILNVTPDSFSDGGRYNDLDKALKQAEKMISEGADVIDVGGESTRPGYAGISSEEEIRRVFPVIEFLKNKFDIPVSVDTYKIETAQKALEWGADMINDIWGLKFGYDTARVRPNKMAAVIAGNKAACCLMHNKNNTNYENIINDVKNGLSESIDIAVKNGIPADKIIIDPGIGFGKTYEQNLTVIKELEKFNDLGYPVLLGASRKSFISKALDVPVEECLEGTLAVTAAAVMKGCAFVRVHDVRENKRVIKIMEAIQNG